MSQSNDHIPALIVAASYIHPHFASEPGMADSFPSAAVRAG
ncbi:MAG TPA: hypothetical protein VG518_02555 [Solirubrobacterales bacterium]|nr:hypothetical protein [Solirubrobacterales bacterium]